MNPEQATTGWPASCLTLPIGRYIEAIPETQENFRQLREAVSDAKKLVAAEGAK